MKKTRGLSIIPLCISGWLLAGCQLPQPLIRDTRASAQVAPLTTPSRYQLLPSQSKALFVAREHYLKPEPYLDLVIGVSKTVTGTIELDPTRPADVKMSPIQVNRFALDMQNDELEEALRYVYLQSDLFPIASFTPLRYEGLPATCTGNEELSFAIVGNLQIRDVIQEIRFDVTAKIESELLVGTATAQMPMTLFGIEPPNKVGQSWVEDGVTVEIEFVAARES